MILSKPDRLTSRIPAVAISSDMEQELKRVSEVYNVSVSEIVRQAIAVFLSDIATHSSELSIQEKAS
jgi:hypothetical protein